MNDSPITGLAPARGKILIEDAVRKVTKLSEEPWPEFELSGMTTVPLDFPTCMIPGFCPEHHKNQHLPKKYNWPCWFAATCGHLHISVINQQLDGPKELRDSLHWATRVAGYIEQPVDYALAERLFRVKALKVLAEIEPSGIALELHLLFNRLLHGEQVHHKVLDLLLEAYRQSKPIWEHYRKHDKPSAMDPIAYTSNAITYPMPHPISISLDLAGGERDLLHAWHSGQRNLSTLESISTRSTDESILSAAPYITALRIALLESLRAALTTEKQSTVTLPRSCEGSSGCEQCISDLWIALASPMTITERTKIWAARQSLGWKIIWV